MTTTSQYFPRPWERFCWLFSRLPSRGRKSRQITLRTQKKYAKNTEVFLGKTTIPLPPPPLPPPPVGIARSVNWLAGSIQRMREGGRGSWERLQGGPSGVLGYRPRIPNWYIKSPCLINQSLGGGLLGSNNWTELNCRVCWTPFPFFSIFSKLEIPRRFF